MKKLLFPMLASILALSCLGLIACGGGQKEEAARESTPGTETTSPEEKTTSGTLSWDDMPIYPGADTDKRTWTFMDMEDGARSETRPYWTEDSFDMVSKFYKLQMPKNGWDQVMWTGVETMAQGIFGKNNDQESAQVIIADKGDGKIAINLTKVTGLNK